MTELDPQKALLEEVRESNFHLAQIRQGITFLVAVVAMALVVEVVGAIQLYLWYKRLTGQ